jgi:hypothetical protein
MAPPSTTLIRTVETADARYVAMNKVSVIINATGTTNSNGWKNPRLEPVVYVQPPPDGIWDFSFVADEPEVSNDVITNVKAATYEWKNVPAGLVVVRVVATTNKLVAKIK